VTEPLSEHLRLNSFETRAAAQGAANHLSVQKGEQHRLVRYEGRWFLKNAVRKMLVTPEGEPLLPEQRP
jgi:hypothetical protein